MTQPFTYAASDVPPPPARRWGEDLWARARSRPEFTPLVGATGGVLALAGLTGLLGELADSDGTRWLAAFVSALVVAGAVYGIRLHPTGPPAAACVAVALLGVPVTVAFVVDTAETTSFRGPASFFLALSTLAWGLLFLTRPTRGRLPFLAVALVGLWLLCAMQLLDFETGDRFGEESREFVTFIPFDLSAGAEDAAGISLIFAAAYLAAGIALDRRGRHGAATPFIGVANVVFIVAVQVLAIDSTSSGAVLGIVIGLTLCWYGTNAQRRMTAWLGAVGLAVSVLALVTEGVEDNVLAAALVLAAGLAIAVGAWWLHGSGTLPRTGADDRPPST